MAAESGPRFFRSPYASLSKLSQQVDRICQKEGPVPSEVLRNTIELAIEIAREGREGRKIGTMFVVGDHDRVLEYSRALILDPLQGHESDAKRIDNSNMRETIKELAQLDGAFVISDKGVAVSATRYLDAHGHDVELPLGLGSRHVAAASITQDTDAIAVVVSESSVVRVLDDGKIVAEILPELWLLQRVRSSIVDATVEEIREENVAVISQKEATK